MLDLTKTITIIFVLMLKDQQIYGRKITANFNAVDCSDYNANYADFIKCWLQPDRRGQLTMNAIFKLKQDLTDIKCKFRFIVERHNNKNMTILAIDLDICKALAEAHKNPILRLVTEEMHRTSNIPFECPLKKNVEYSICNFTINSKYIPPFAPPMKWFAHAEFYANSTKEKFLQYLTTGRVVHI